MKRFVVRRLPFSDGGWAIFDKEKDEWYKEHYQTKCFDKRSEAIKKANKLNGAITLILSKRGSGKATFGRVLRDRLDNKCT